MTPSIPLTPQQRRKRRNNIIFLCSCAGFSLLILGFFFRPENKPQVAVEPNVARIPLTEQQSSSAPATEGAPNADYTPDTPYDQTADWDGGDIPESPGGSDSGTATTTSGSGSDSGSTADSMQLSEDELAKLPPWQAAFARMPLDNRLAFATAFAKAKASYNAEQWTHCLALLNDCELIFNNSPNVWNLRSCALLAINALDEAETSINRSLALNAEDSVALMCLSELHMLRRHYQESIPILEQLRRLHPEHRDLSLYDTFTFHQLLCHLMLRQEMEARALVAHLTPMSDSPLYYFAQAAFCVYSGDSNAALEPLRSATTIFGNGGATASYRKWMEKCGLTDKYIRNKRR